jgi:hypothetical protein
LELLLRLWSLVLLRLLALRLQLRWLMRLLLLMVLR